MKTLLLLRHAKSSWRDTSIDDYERPLNKRGKKDAPRIGQLLRDEALIPDLILSSAARRCRKTTEEVTKNSGYRGETRLLGELYEADGNKLRECISRLDDNVNRVLLVGHNPGLEHLLDSLVEGHTPLPTAAMAHLELQIESWRDFSDSTRGSLLRLWRPEDVKSGT